MEQNSFLSFGANCTVILIKLATRTRRTSKKHPSLIDVKWLCGSNKIIFSGRIIAEKRYHRKCKRRRIQLLHVNGTEDCSNENSRFKNYSVKNDVCSGRYKNVQLTIIIQLSIYTSYYLHDKVTRC